MVPADEALRLRDERRLRALCIARATGPAAVEDEISDLAR